jgi:hypothetical protein
MRQATPHIQWFSLVFADDSVRHEFLAALEDNPPVAILLTNSQWPQPDGFDAADGWAKFAMLLTSRYVLDRAKTENSIAWRLYLRRVARLNWMRCSQARRRAVQIRSSVRHLAGITGTNRRDHAFIREEAAMLCW